MLLSVKTLAANHSNIALKYRIFLLHPNRATHNYFFMLFAHQVRQCNQHQNNQNNCHVSFPPFSLSMFSVSTSSSRHLHETPPLQALWIICSNFLPLSADNFIAAFCDCPLIDYIIPLSVKKGNMLRSASFFLFTANIDSAYCVFTCSFYISDSIIPSLWHIQFDMIKRRCTFLCPAAKIY